MADAALPDRHDRGRCRAARHRADPVRARDAARQRGGRRGRLFQAAHAAAGDRGARSRGDADPAQGIRANEDPILHNAFSTSPGNAFDTGVYGAGDGAQHTFPAPGLVKVYCNVHHSMVGHILVLDTPYFARPDAEGNFVLRDLPSEEGELVVFHDRTEPWRQTLLPGADPVPITLQVIRRKVPPHMNKFGKPYGSSTPGKY
jgi:hypothetical protein